MRSVLRLLALEWAPIWSLVLLLAVDVAIVKDSGRGVGVLAPPMMRACIVTGPTGWVIEDEQGLRVELRTTELWHKERQGEVRVLAKMYRDQSDPLGLGLIMECAQGERVGIRAWTDGGQPLPSEEMMRRGFAAILAKQAAALPPLYEAEAKRQLDYAERLARGERWQWTLAPGACVHEAAVLWVLLVILVRGWMAWSGWVSKALQVAGKGMLAVEEAAARRKAGGRARVESERC